LKGFSRGKKAGYQKNCLCLLSAADPIKHRDDYAVRNYPEKGGWLWIWVEKTGE